MTLTATGMIVGKKATISITSNSRVGQDVPVTITGAGGQQTIVHILIGAGGTGLVEWTVQSWGTVTIVDGTCEQLMVTLEEEGEQPGGE